MWLQETLVLVKQNIILCEEAIKILHFFPKS